MALWGKMERGKMAPSILPPKVFDFAPVPWFVLPHAHSTYENFRAESD